MPSAMKKSKVPVKATADAGKKKNAKGPLKGPKNDKPMKAKEERPKKKLSKEADKAARMAIGSGDLAKDEVNRKKEQDSRTLYIRFGDKDSLPTSEDDIKALHSDIKFVRTPRKAVKSTNDIRYAFLEFGSADECKAARGRLATTQYKGKELIVDFVGEASKNKAQGKGKTEDKAPSRLNPTRLFICGLAPGVSKTNLKEMFPKASHADIPANSKKKGTSYGFVQFSSPGDAKAAFDAAKGLSIGGHKITVLFAKITDKKPEVVQKKKEKRDKKNAEKKLEKEEGEEVKPKKAEKRKKEEEAAEEVVAKKVKLEKAVKAETEALLATEEESDDEEDESEEETNAVEGGEEEDDEDDEDSDDEVEGEGGDVKDDEEEEEDDDENDDDDSEDEDEEGADQKSDNLIQEAEEASDDEDDEDDDDDEDEEDE